jgi:8-oxo-dGTP pyrophosphatase MutT (NUDIX family)
MSVAHSRLPVGWSRPPVNLPSPKFLRISHLRKLLDCEQVAAVCYRLRGANIEFLLVQTRGGGRWIFPKGSAERGLTHAQAAALEAFEEAGVHGRIEEAAFTQYFPRKSGASRNSHAAESPVSAHLCEVRKLDPPQEANRKPTWLSPEKAKERLREGRNPAYGVELARVVDRAVARISRLHGMGSPSAAIQRTQPIAIDFSRSKTRQGLVLWHRR